MIKIKIRNVALIEKGLLSLNEISLISSFLEKHAVFDNPLFEKVVSLSLYKPIKYFPPAKIKVYSENNDFYILPLGLYDQFLNIIKGSEISTEDERYDIQSSFNFVHYFTLREYQKKIVDEVEPFERFVVIAPGGSGKSVMMMELIKRRHKKTLIIVPTKEIAMQWIEIFNKKTNFKKVGFIGAGFNEISDITISLFQTLARFDQRMLEDLSSVFGMVFLDEANRLPCRSIFRLFNSLNIKTKASFGAEIRRRDKMEFLIPFAFSHKIFKLSQDDIKSFLSPIEVIVYDFYNPIDYWPRNPFSVVYDQLIENEDRNQFILSLCKDSFKGKQILILSDRVEHVLALAKMGDFLYIYGDLPLHQRKKALEEFKEKKRNVLVATFPTLNEGVDIPSLDVVILATPHGKNYVLLNQAIGRLRRKAIGKEKGILIDINDQGNPYLERMAQRRIRVYQENGLRITREKVNQKILKEVKDV